MSHKERTIIYSLLALIGGLNIVLLLAAPAGRAAVADAMSPQPQEAGAVDSIKLKGDTGELVLRNKAGRLSWSEHPGAASYSVAFMHVGKALGQLMEKEEFAEERKTLRDELVAENERRRGEIETIFGQLEAMDPNSPEFEEAREKASALYEQFQQSQVQGRQRESALEAQQIERAYREVTEAVEVVADRMKIDIVYRFIPTDEEFATGSAELAMRSIIARTALRYPDELDMTADVMEELSLDVE
jgi:hypothetical protein